MHLPKKSSKSKGFHSQDAQLAIELIIAGDKTLNRKIVAAGSNIEYSRFTQCLNNAARTSRVTDYMRDYANASAKPTTTTHYVFEDREYTLIAQYLGTQCGFAKGFTDVGAMISYAQEHCRALPEGARWVREDYPTQADAQEQAHFTANMERYRVAASLLADRVTQDGVSFGKLAADIPINVVPRFKAFIYHTKTAQINPLNLQQKIEFLSSFSQRLGQAMRRSEPLDLEGMVALADTLFPGEIPPVASARPKDRRNHDHGGGWVL